MALPPCSRWAGRKRGLQWMKAAAAAAAFKKGIHEAGHK